MLVSVYLSHYFTYKVTCGMPSFRYSIQVHKVKEQVCDLSNKQRETITSGTVNNPAGQMHLTFLVTSDRKKRQSELHFGV